jgi:muramoyltetrapeptide carboxypeptidase
MIIPQYLKSGDKVGVVATAKVVDKANTLYGIDMLKQWGLNVEVGLYVFEKYFQFAGTDEQRTEDLQRMIDDPEIKAIFMVRGGYGSTRIIDRIDYAPLVKNPKWICGFSDITAFHLHLYHLGIASFHAPMPSFFHALDQQSLNRYQSMLLGNMDIMRVRPHHLNKKGKATGKLVGGNLSMICHTIGTPSEIETEGNLLFFEDIGENLYRIDRMLVQLKRAGFLQHLAGLIVGQFSDMEDNEDSFGLNAFEIIHSHISAFDYPVAFDFPIGHTSTNFALPVGLEATLIVDEKAVQLDID